MGVPVQTYTLESTCLILGFVCFVDNERERENPDALKYHSGKKCETSDVRGYITIYLDTGDKFVSGVVGTAEQFIPGVFDTADKHSFAIISANFQKKSKRYSEPQEILIKKKLKSKISCHTPFKWLVVTNGRLLLRP
jgi:hypothetical protein